MGRVATGLDILRDDYWKKLKGCKLGLLSNQASLDSRLISAKEIISRLLPGHLTVLFGPQHGYQGVDQDNMVETDHAYDKELSIPVFSLYSQDRAPLPEMLELLDILIIDLQDVGTRVYTFASTVLNCLKAAAEAGKKVLILDRPNPLGGEIVEGNLLKPEFYSFIGPYQFPMRHGLTMAEMAQIFNHVFRIEAALDIVLMKGWGRSLLWPDTGLKWIMPSPNMPLAETAMVYPGQVVWEGTNLSEGRGTCRPFEIFGAPFLKPELIRQKLSPEMTTGCYLQEISFRPTFHKWDGEICWGFMVHVLDPQAYRPYFTTIALLMAMRNIHGQCFEWKNPPYEYEYEKMPIDLILGDSCLRDAIEKEVDLFQLKQEWDKKVKIFKEWRTPYLLYN